MRVLGEIDDVPRQDWNRLAGADASPFVRWEFLAALEQSGCVRDAEWKPRHLTLWRGGELVAAAPAYVKSDSEGDFSRDWDWAAAALRAGIAYYPKLVVTVPFTPATGRRLLVAAGEDRAACVRELVEGARRLARAEALGGVHVLFGLEDEVRELEGLGFGVRTTVQYHWVNEGYGSFDDFLARFPSKKRTMIRRELRAPEEQGISIRTVRGEELAREARARADEMYALHAGSVDRMAWGMRWVNREFYRRVVATMADAVEIVEARREGRVVAAAFNVAGGGRLYGRYWGAREEHPFLHFNVCLYHSVRECIQNGVKVFEGGAGGEHKLVRGFEPALTYGGHWMADARLDAAVRRMLEVETPARREAVERWRREEGVLRRG